MKKKFNVLFCVLITIIFIFISINIANATEEANIEKVQEILSFEELESNKYIIDDSSKIIYRIMPQTTVEDLKKNFKNPDIIKIYNNEHEQEVLDSDIVGTGMLLENTTNSDIYYISVIGDVDGDGLIGLAELTRLIRSVVGLNEYQLSGFVMKSADMNNDSNINHIDITILIRYIVYGELEVEEATEVKSPIIKILEGKTGENDWYLSDVKFNIEPNEENTIEIAKTTYKITGTVEIEETEINSEEKITLSDGEYHIVAYSYSADGFKSLATRLDIKIDTIAPQIGKLKMCLDEENGIEYEQDTWTSHNVIISSIDGDDDMSGHAQTTYHTKNNEEIPEGTTGIKTLSKSGIYEIILSTKDNAGNVSTEEYKIKIDNNLLEAPSITVIEGTQKDNEWYVDNVVLKVKKAELVGDTSPINKITYKIEGPNQVDETEIDDEGTIEITEDGISTISVYNYNEAGRCSEAKTIEIKKDETAPEVGTLNMFINDDEKKPYESDTWTSKNVELNLVEGSDVTSGHNDTSYYVENVEEIPEGTKDSKTLSNTGKYKAVVVTKDNAGNVSTNEYIIKIDNRTIVPPEIKVVSGDKNAESDWYYNDIVLEIEQQPQSPDASKIVRNTYKIEGTETVEEKDIEDKGQINITGNGTYTITAYSYNETGERSEGTKLTVKKDDTIPRVPIISVEKGTQQNNNWYIDNVTLKVVQAEIEEPLSPIKRLTYKVEGAGEKEFTDIENEGTIEITADGISTISVYNYNEAGTRSEAATITIQKDSQNPEQVQISYEELKSDSYTLVCKGSDVTSGISNYEVYIDNVLSETIYSEENEVRCEINDQTSGTYSVYIVAKDKSGRSTESERINIKMAKLENDKIGHIEFIIDKFTITDDQNRVATHGLNKTISDTSLTPISKYMMLTAKEENLTGTIEGKMRIIHKNGNILEDLDFFPEDLKLNLEYYTNGSGSQFSHENEVRFFGNDLNTEHAGDATPVDTTLDLQKITENKFTITEKKTKGIETFVRTTIKSITLGEQQVEFKIVEN